MPDPRFPLSEQAIAWMAYFCRITPADLPEAMRFASCAAVQRRLHEKGMALLAAQAAPANLSD